MQKINRYYMYAFGIAWIVQIGLSLSISKIGVTGFRLGLIAVMYIPFLAVFLAGYSIRDLGWRPNIRKNWKYWLEAWFLPGILTACGFLLFLAVFPKSLDLSGRAMTAQLGEGALEQLEAQGLTYPKYILVSIVQALLFIPFINMFPSLGEEIGWRGVMTPHLITKYGKQRGLLLAGILWGIWHWPIIILAGYEYGTVYPGAPVTGPLLFCLITVALGILHTYVYEKTGSILAPAVFHGSFNAWATIPMAVTAPEYASMTLLGPAPVGILAALPMILCAWYILRKKEA